MTKTHRALTLLAVLAASVLCVQARAGLSLPGLFGDGMVLQCDMGAPVWGWADPKAEVTVRFGGQSKRATVDGFGRWRVTLAPMKANASPAVMVVASGKSRLEIKDVLVGEVWLCAGQSNMAMRLKETARGKRDGAASELPRLRLYGVSRAVAGFPTPANDGRWRASCPTYSPHFSAVAYYFGRALHKELKVPVGIIKASWGSTAIEPWTPLEGFERIRALAHIPVRIREAHGLHKRQLRAYLPRLKAWANDATNRAVPAGAPKHPLASAKQPTGIFNGMISPLAPFALRGAIWYQGESNVGDGLLYADKMKALVSGWRRVWGQGDFPFYFVQIAPCFEFAPGELPKLWLGQYRAAREIANCGMVSPVDVGDIRDPHPTRKAPVGNRLAMMALARTYGRKGIDFRSPKARAVRLEGKRVRVSFDHVGVGGLVSLDRKRIRWCELAGKDGVFHKAEARIDGATLLVSTPKVERPTVVRYAWHRLAVPNLNAANGLPVLPFLKTVSER